MKTRFSSSLPCVNASPATFCTGVLNRVHGAGLLVLFIIMSGFLTTISYAQEGISLEELEQKLAEQRVALEEAIANRESTAAKAQEIRQEQAESEERQRAVREELEELCNEQKELQPGSFDDCISDIDN